MVHEHRVSQREAWPNEERCEVASFATGNPKKAQSVTPVQYDIKISPNFIQLHRMFPYYA